MAHDVFISYSHHDKATGDAVCARLEVAHVRCWIAPRDIAPGEDWAAAIPKAIHTARVMVVVFSHNTNLSRQISREVEIAVDGGLVIIPLRIDDVMPEGSFEYYLSTEHWLDALTPPLETHLDHLTTSISKILSPDQLTPAPVAPGAGETSAVPRPPTEVRAREAAPRDYSMASMPPNPPVSGWGPQSAPPPPSVAAVPNHMVWAIVSIFLFWPTAIPAIIYASRVNSAVAMNDVAGAVRTAKLAVRFCWISTALGAALLFAIIIVAVSTPRSTLGY